MTAPSAETWRPVVGYDGLYEVSDLGKVRSLDHVTTSTLGRDRHFPGRELSQALRSNGYFGVLLYRNGHRKHVWTHQLVAEAFLGSRPHRMEVRHLDGDPRNNNAANLAYGTHVDNLGDTITHRTHYNAFRSHCVRGHRLAAPNLMNRADGFRACLACSRARNAHYRATARGEPFDLQADADRRYGDLMGELHTSRLLNSRVRSGMSS